MWYTFFKTLFKCRLFYKAALTQEPWSDSVSLLLPPVCSLLRYFCASLSMAWCVLLTLGTRRRQWVLCKCTVNCPGPGEITSILQTLGAPWAFSRSVRVKEAIPGRCWKVGCWLQESLLLPPLPSLHHRSCLALNEHPK